MTKLALHEQIPTATQHRVDGAFFEARDRFDRCVTIGEAQAVYAEMLQAGEVALAATVDADERRRLHAFRVAFRDAWLDFVTTHRAHARRGGNHAA